MTKTSGKAATRLDMVIAGWSAEGLRCPDHTVSLLAANGSVHPLALIQMPNGTGKTTTLELLRIALSGTAAVALPPDRVRQFRKKSHAATRGRFKVDLLYGTKKLTITLDFDFDSSSVSCKTTLGSGMKHGFHPPLELRRFLSEDFVGFFVFDGELAENLLDRDHTNAQSAIEDLFSLKVLDRLSSRVDEYWQAKTANKGATETRGLNRRRNRVETLESVLEQRRSERSALEGKRDEFAKKLADHKRRFQDRISRLDDYNDRLSQAEVDFTKAENEISRTGETCLSTMRDPQTLSTSFGVKMILLRTSFDRAKLPETAAREFFEELASEEACICGRELTNDTRDAIRARAAQYLGTDDVALLNSIKSDIAQHVGVDAAAHETRLEGEIKTLLEASRRALELRTERDAIRDEAIGSSPELEAAQQEIGRLENQLAALEQSLERYEDPSDSANDRDIYGVAVLERRLADAQRKLAEVTNTLELKARRDVLVQVLKSARESARRQLSENMCQEANKRIAALMPHNAIRIQEINKSLVLQGQERGSMGETLCVAYAFLSSLFSHGEYQLPFVADSPANPIDLKVRGSVAELIPALARQFIAFTISSERAGFLEPLQDAAKARCASIKYLTVFRRGEKSIDAAARKTSRFVETVDGMIVEGDVFFQSFQLEKES